MEHVATNLVDRQFSPTIENSRNEAHASGVSWPAVIAGAFVAAALSLCLLALGTGLGLSAVSPWSGEGASASTIGAAGIVWLIIMQVIAAAMGGYLAGRLRTKWTGVHTDEVFFRDTRTRLPGMGGRGGDHRSVPCLGCFLDDRRYRQGGSCGGSGCVHRWSRHDGRS